MEEGTKLPVMAHNCGTCPFKCKDPQWTAVRPMLEMRALNVSPICHSTGPDALVDQGATKVNDAPHVCRGARDYQLTIFHRIGFIAEPTDKAWDAAWEEMQKARV